MYQIMKKIEFLDLRSDVHITFYVLKCFHLVVLILCLGLSLKWNFLI